jgi:hypothetical protein
MLALDRQTTPRRQVVLVKDVNVFIKVRVVWIRLKRQAFVSALTDIIFNRWQFSDGLYAEVLFWRASDRQPDDGLS